LSLSFTTAADLFHTLKQASAKGGPSYGLRALFIKFLKIFLFPLSIFRETVRRYCEGRFSDPRTNTQKRNFAMSQTGTVKLHRVLRAPAERIYRAFTDADAMCKWLPPHGFTGRMHKLDAKVGGGYHMSFTNLTTGKGHSFSATYTELIPGELIRHTDRFDDPNLPGEMQVTITFRKVLCGTEVNIEQSGIPAAIPVEFCYAGWQESLELLALLVNPEIPDAP
jgi:uncharacterized protein YndB with AHSA1/START domain